eukprot:scaffold11656_cov85-Skeletonema_dohrnii-CCMP3373.AAC.4
MSSRMLLQNHVLERNETSSRGGAEHGQTAESVLLIHHHLYLLCFTSLTRHIFLHRNTSLETMLFRIIHDVPTLFVAFRNFRTVSAASHMRRLDKSKSKPMSTLFRVQLLRLRLAIIHYLESTRITQRHICADDMVSTSMQQLMNSDSAYCSSQEQRFRSVAVAMSASYANLHASIASINVSLSLFDVTDNDNAVKAEIQAFTIEEICYLMVTGHFFWYRIT